MLVFFPGLLTSSHLSLGESHYDRQLNSIEGEQNKRMGGAPAEWRRALMTVSELSR